MKKLFTLGLVLLSALTANAQEVRKLWDFTEGFSQQTLDNLAADAASGSGYWTDGSAKGYYESKARTAGPVVCKVNGEDWVIPETEGLTFDAVSKQHLNIVFQSDKLGPHMWLNGKKAEDAITIPSVPAGDSIYVVYSSHKDTENRGFQVKTDGVVSKADGSTTKFTTMGRDTVVLINNNETDTDVKLQATNGMHFHYICVGVRTPKVVSPKQMAYIYSSANGYERDNDMAYFLVGEDAAEKFSEGLEVTELDVTQDLSLVTADSLKQFDVVVVSPTVSASDAYASTIKEAIAYVPMLNLSPNLYETWGYGKATESTTNTLTVGVAARTTDLFKPNSTTVDSYIDENGQLPMYATSNITGYTAEEGTYFASDSIIATAGDVNAIHIHNNKRNAYLMIPLTGDDFTEAFEAILPNSIATLVDTKTAVTETGKPSVNEDYHNLYTTVSLSSATKKSTIYYTIDGSEPTMASTVYTEPFDINTTGVTVKAIAKADGYTLSDVSEKTISIRELAKSPTINVEEVSGQTTVTIVPNNDGDVIWYNYTSSDDSTKSSKYTEPIVLTKHATITAFTGEQGEYLQSEVVTKDITVQDEKVRMDVLAHFDANKTDYYPTTSGSQYFVSKSASNYYTDEVIDTKIYKDQEGNDSIVNVYKEANNPFYHNPGTGWEIVTYGQVVAHESNSLGHNVGDPSAYNPQTAFDDAEELATNYHITFGAVGSNGDGVKDPANAYIQTTVKYQGPFDIVSIMAGYGSNAAVYVSTDTTDVNNWVKVGDVNVTKSAADTQSKGRMYVRTINSYEGTDEVFVKFAAASSSGRLFDVILKNEGEISKEYLSGIVDVNNGKAAEGEVVRTIVYSLNGTQQLNGTSKGINIVKQIYANGAVKTKKVIVK